MKAVFYEGRKGIQPEEDKVLDPISTHVTILRTPANMYIFLQSGLYDITTCVYAIVYVKGLWSSGMIVRVTSMPCAFQFDGRPLNSRQLSQQRLTETLSKIPSQHP